MGKTCAFLTVFAPMLEWSLKSNVTLGSESEFFLCVCEMELTHISY